MKNAATTVPAADAPEMVALTVFAVTTLTAAKTIPAAITAKNGVVNPTPCTNGGIL